MKEKNRTSANASSSKEQEEAFAAIAMALSAYRGDNIHDEESGMLTISYVNSHWNNLI